MKNGRKTRDELLAEVAELRRQLAELRADGGDRERADDSLRQSEQRYRTLVESAQECIFIVSRDGRVQYVNAFAAGWLRSSPERIVGHPIREFFPPGNADRMLERIEGVHDTGRPAFFIDPISFPGHEAWLETWLVPMVRDGAVTGVIGTARDVTARHKAEEAIWTQSQIIEQIHDGVVATDLQGRITSWNNGVAELMGYSREEMIGRHISCLYPEDRREFLEQEVVEPVRAKGRHDVEVEVRKKSDEPVLLRLALSMLTDHDGQPVGMVGSGVDITARKRAEDALRKAHEELEGRVAERTAEVSRANELLKEEIAERRRAEDGLRLQRDLMLALGSTTGVTGALNLILDTALKVGAADCGGIYLVHPATGSIDLVVHRGLSAKFIGGVLHFAADSARARLIRDGKPAYFGHGEMPPTPGTAEEGVKALAIIPVHHQGQAVACINLASHVVEEISPKARDVLETIAGNIGGQIARIQARTALQEREQLYRQHFENVSDVVVSVDASLTVTSVSPSVTRVFGYRPEEIVGRRISDLGMIVREHRGRVLQDAARGLAGESLTVEYEVVSKSGAVVPVEVSGAPVTRDGRIVGTVAVIRDITLRKRAEDELRRNEEKMRALLQAIPDLIFRFSRDGVFLDCVSGGAEAPALPPEKFLGKTFEDVLPSGLAGRFRQVLGRTFETGQVQIVEYQIPVPLPDGPMRDYEARFVVSGQDEALAIIRNVALRKQAEGKLMVYQEQLRSLASQLSLSEEHERRRIASELHDRIGQALALARIKLGMFRESMGLAGAARQDGTILAEVFALIEQTITDTRTLTFELSPPVLYELGFVPAIEWLADQIGRQFGIRVDFRDDGQAKPLADDIRVLLFQGTRELLVNAGKHAKAGRASVLVSRVGDAIRIEVRDDGVGMDPAAAESRRGAGFGLFSLRERLGHLGGRLSIESNPGASGSCLTLVAPLQCNLPIVEIDDEYPDTDC